MVVGKIGVEFGNQTDALLLPAIAQENIPMAKQPATRSAYMVSIYDDPEKNGALRFTFVPSNGRSQHQSRQPPPEYIVSVKVVGDEIEFEWREPKAADKTIDELQEIARARVMLRRAWLEKLHDLVAKVKKWAEELGWATKVVDKKMEDAEIGNYKAPAILLQQDVVRLFLEPVARVAPGTEGVVDLYLMPSYDDIASLYYYSKQWNIHYAFSQPSLIAKIDEAEARPLSKSTLRKVLDQMKAHVN